MFFPFTISNPNQELRSRSLLQLKEAMNPWSYVDTFAGLYVFSPQEKYELFSKEPLTWEKKKIKTLCIQTISARIKHTSYVISLYKH